MWGEEEKQGASIKVVRACELASPSCVDPAGARRAAAQGEGLDLTSTAVLPRHRMGDERRLTARSQTRAHAPRICWKRK